MTMSALVAELRETLPTGHLLVDGDMSPFTTDSSPGVAGTPCAVVVAITTADVSAALAWASRHDIAVVARGAGTGVSGGALAADGALTISLARMTDVVEIHPEDRFAVVQPGVTVDELDRLAGSHELMYAPDPASSATASIGGTIATNAGGLRCLSHGVTADAVSALTVVLADGRVLHTGTRSRKNVAGYDLTRLFVGSEGTLGVITEATVRLVPRPRGNQVTFSASFPDLTSAARAVSEVMRGAQTPEILELIDRTTANLIEDFSPSGLNRDAAGTLIGLLIGGDASTTELMRDLMEHHGAISFAAADDDHLLDARKKAFPALEANGMGVGWVASDSAVPPSRLPELLAFVEQESAREKRTVAVVAHAGDGNIHAAISASSDVDDMSRAHDLAQRIAQKAVELGGTVTGEHGIGSLKTDLLDIAFDEVARNVHHAVKAALDPKGILAPGRAIGVAGTR